MNTPEGTEFYLSHRSEILKQFDTHAEAWKPFLANRYGDGFAKEILRQTRKQYQELIPNIPYIGGNENPMTRHLIRSTTSLVFYKAMKACGKIVYDAVVASVSQLPARPALELTKVYMAEEKARAQKSQERWYSSDWVWEFVEGNGVEFDYGHDYLECGTQKLYHAHDADEFLPFYCYLDFVTNRNTGWGFVRTKTLAQGFDRCDFRWKKGGETKSGWPPPFVRKPGNP